MISNGNDMDFHTENISMNSAEKTLMSLVRGSCKKFCH